MANILIRNVPQATVNKLKAQAKRHARSLQAEALAALQIEAPHSGDAFIRTLERLRSEGQVSFDVRAALTMLRDDRLR